MKNKYLAGIIPLLIGAVFQILFIMQGGSAAIADKTSNSAFALISIAIMFYLTGVVILAILFTQISTYKVE